MSAKLEDKLNSLEQKYRGDKQKIYFEEIIMNHPQIIVQDFKKGYTQLGKKCQLCPSTFCRYYSMLKEIKNKADDQRAILCTICTYRILSSKLQNIKIQYSQNANNCKVTTDKVSEPIISSATNAQASTRMQEDEWANELDGYSLNFQQYENDDYIELGVQKKSFLSESNFEDKQQTISSKQSSHRYEQEQKIKIQYTSKQESLNPILELLQKINHNQYKEINPVLLFVKMIVFEFTQKQEKKSGLHQSNYLNYFERNILRQIISKTYNQKDRIKKNQIQFIYQYWLKALKKYLQANNQTKIREYNNRHAELSKKITMRDRKIAQLNKGFKTSTELIGFKKNGAKWNQIIKQMRMKQFNFQNLKDAKFLSNY